MKKNILVVDNQPIILKFMTDLLEKESHMVQTAEDGLAALDILKKFVPDVIFIDLVMPNINGKKLCRIIRSMPLLKDAYIIILSAIAAEEKLDFAEFGANACIAKGPFNSMSKHVLDSLDSLDHSDPKTQRGISKKIRGIEDIHHREIIKELLYSKRHFEAILNNMTEGIIELTMKEKIIYANPSAISLIGIPEEKLLASHFADLFHNNQQQKIKKLLGNISSAPHKAASNQLFVLNGRQVLLFILPIKDEKYKPMNIVILNDVSEEKIMEAQLHRAQKMEAIGTLAGGIAHDFNNLLMGIQGNISLMLLDIDPTKHHYKKLKTIEQFIQNGAQLTKQLLGFARGGKYEVKPSNLNEIVEKSSILFGRTKKEIHIYKEYQDEVWTVKVDRSQIEQVLLNIYINAWQAMSGGGDIYLQTENIVLDENDTREYQTRPGKYVKISVRDTGAGIDNLIRHRIFDPFFTTREMGRGTGLGLASSYGIIRNHDGFINFYSKKGKGTTFNIFLPVFEKQLSKEKIQPEKGLKKKIIILFVDDEKMIVDVGAQMLKVLGYDVLIARSGKEAVEIVSKTLNSLSAPNLAIIDMIMPDMGGGETYDRIKKINPNIQVLLSSGYSIDGEAANILKRGCNGFIQKPFSIDQLSDKIKEVLIN
jgi:PAS domain S-box-containing protein